MRFVLSSAAKDLRRRARDPIALGLWLGIPLVTVLLLYLVFGRGGAMPRGLLLVADEDKTLLSSLFAGAFNQGRLAEMITVEKVDRDAGRARLNKGEASALLVIPKGFTAALLNDEPLTLSLVTNPAQTILPGIIRETLSILIEAAHYLQSLVPEQLKVFAKGPPPGASTFSDATIADISVQFNRLGQKLQKYVSPLLIELETKVVEEKTSATANFAAFFFPTTLFMSLLFMAQGLSEDIWREQAQGALRRVAATPRRMEAFLAGKLLGGAALAGAMSLPGLLIGRYLVGVEVRSFLPALAWLAFAGVLLFLLLLLLQVHASSARTGYLLTGVVLFPLLMLGGAFFPLELMPATLATVGRWTPNGWLLVQFKAILAGQVELASMARGGAVFAAGGLLAFWIASRRLRQVLARL